MGGRSRIIDLPSVDQTHRFGRYLAARLVPSGLLALSGPLGVGKTCLIQAIASELKIVEPIQSPTFTYFQAYLEGVCPLYHFDLYRMKSPSDFFSLGFDEYFDTKGITVIEWAERMERFLPPYAIFLHLSYLASGRRICLSSAAAFDLINPSSAWD